MEIIIDKQNGCVPLSKWFKETSHIEEREEYDDLERYLHTEVDDGIELGLTDEEVREISNATSPVKIVVEEWRFFNRGDDWVLIFPWQRIRLGEEMTLSMHQMKNYVSTRENPKRIANDEVSLVDKNEA